MYIVVDVILKPLVCRERPFSVEDFNLLIPAPDTWSFPSGHTALAFAVATVIFIHSRRWGYLALVYAILVGFSRLYFCVHWPTDVAAGEIIGVITAILVVWSMSRWIPYFRDLDRGRATLRDGTYRTGSRQLLVCSATMREGTSRPMPFI